MQLENRVLDPNSFWKEAGILFTSRDCGMKVILLYSYIFGTSCHGFTRMMVMDGLLIVYPVVGMWDAY